LPDGTFPVDLKVSPDGSLYYLARGGGFVSQIRYTAGTLPQITQHPANQMISIGQSATFSVSASGLPPLGYQWQRNGSNIVGATSSSYTLSNVQLTDNGALFRALVSNSLGTATSNTAQLTVVDTTPPVLSITNPAQGSTVVRKSTVTLSAMATDNVGVVRVEFYVKGSLQCTDATVPYNCNWKVPNPPNITYQIQAKAYDQAGNFGSAAVQVTSR